MDAVEYIWSVTHAGARVELVAGKRAETVSPRSALPATCHESQAVRQLVHGILSEQQMDRLDDWHSLSAIVHHRGDRFGISVMAEPVVDAMRVVLWPLPPVTDELTDTGADQRR